MDTTTNRSNPTTDFLEFPDTGSLTANRTYVVRTDHYLTSGNSNMPANVTLYFMGGRLLLNSSTPSVNTLTGNHTRLIAPPEQIFGDGLTATGLWDIDRAYPQWFGAIAYADIDSSTAINKAIQMKLTGEVFIPRGVYRIDSSIKVRNGILLTGELGMYADPLFNSTILTPGPIVSAATNFIKGYFMRVNANDDDSWIVQYPDL